MSEKKPPWARRAFRFLLRMFPFDFRWDFGREMEQTFEEQRADAEKQGGKIGVLRLWWETIAGVFTTAPREHWEMLRQDAGYALRMMRKNPGFTAAAVLTLGLGIGANTAIFSVVYGVLLRPLPYGSGEQLVRLRQEARLRNQPNIGFSEKELMDFRQQTQTLEGLVEYHNMNFILLGGEEAKRVNTGVVSPEFFSMFGVKPVLGRDFRAEDDKHGADAVLLLNHRFWQKAFGGDPKIVGRVFRMNDRPHTVIGVLPPLPLYPDENDVYMPVSSCPFRSAQQTRENRNARMVRVFARVKPGASFAQAQTDLTTIAGRLESAYPDAYPKSFGYTASAVSLREEMTQGARDTFLVLLGTAGFVLLIACSNVANLTLARLLRRERELSMRAALGASRVRLMRQLLTESTMFSLLGGVFGLGIAAASMQMLAQFAARFTPRANEVHMDPAVLVFTLAVSVLTGVVFGSLPAMASARSLFQSLHEGGRTTGSAGGNRTRNALIVAQVAFSFVLLIGAGLMLRSFAKLMEVSPGFTQENVLSARLTLNFSIYTTPEKTRAFYRQLFEKLDRMPEVVSRAALSTIPLAPGAGRFNQRFQIEGRRVEDRGQLPTLDLRVATPDYFRTVGVPLVRGRVFTEFDHDKAEQVVLLNQSLARRHWKDEDPVGRRISFDNGETWTTVIGVVGDVKQYGLDRDATDEAYVPLAQGPFANSVFLRTSGEATQAAQALRKAIYETDSTIAVDRFLTLEQVKNESVATPRLTATLMGLFAGLALLITATGIAGVMALAVNQRTHEIGIRMALGATPGSVLRMVLRQGLTVVVIGLALGVGGAVALARMMKTLLYAVEPTDPATFVAVSLVLLVCAAAACFLPARRAATIDPMNALRAE